MKRILKALAGIVALTLFFTDCQSSGAGPTEKAPDLVTRNNVYSLLHQLLGEQKEVKLLRFIKHEDKELTELTKRIGKTSGTGEKLLEELARKDPTIKLDDIELPLGETATRDAIASAKEKELLTGKGRAFEVALLLSQVEALSYGWHLAEVAEKNEQRPEAATAVRAIGEDLRQLYEEVFAMILAETEPTANSGK